MTYHKKGYTLIEILVVIGIIGLLAALITVFLASAGKKGRDAKRKNDLSQIGRILSLSCYLPDGGGGEYDLADLMAELKIKFPQYNSYLPSSPKDPIKGTATQSFYYYQVTADGKKCALYGNLENDNEKITLSGLTSPTPGGGNGVFESAAVGWNGTNKYFQNSN